MGDLEEQRQVELKMIREEKDQLQTLILRQTAIICELEQQLLKVSSNNTLLQHQQQELLETVNNLIHTISAGSVQGGSTLRVNRILSPYSIVIDARQTSYVSYFGPLSEVLLLHLLLQDPPSHDV